MRNIFLLLLFSIYLNVSAQETPATFWNNRCEYKTDGSGKSLGLKIKLSVPCVWTQADGDRPHVVKKFSYNLEGNLAMSTLTINKMPATPTKAEADELFSEKGLKEFSKDLGTFISGRKLKVDGLDCGEISFKMTRESPIATLYLYNLYYYFIYKDKMIVIGYSSGATTDKKAKELFESYKPLFKGLATNTIFLSKWE